MSGQTSTSSETHFEFLQLNFHPGPKTKDLRPKTKFQRPDPNPYRSAQHAAHRVAANGIDVKQRGQSLVFGGGGGAALSLLIPFTIRKTTKPMIKKVRTSSSSDP